MEKRERNLTTNCGSMMEQKLILQEDVPAFSSGSVGCENAMWLQHLYAHVHLGLKLKGSLTEKLYLEGPYAEPNRMLQDLEGLHMEPNRMRQNYPCSQQSKEPKQKHPQENIAKFVDSGDQNEGSLKECPSEALQNTYITRKRKSKADSSNFEDYMPHSYVQRQQLGSLNCCNSQRHGSRKGKDKADSSDSETYIPRPRVRGQRRKSLHGSKSVTEQGMLDSKTFEFYFGNIWSGISEEKRNSFAYLDSLWFNLYTKSYYKEKVLNWIKRKDIFSKKYVLVPIVIWSHWSLLILCHFGEESKSKRPCMVLLDSLQLANQNLEPHIRQFVLDIHKTEGRPANRESMRNIPLLVPKVPQQRKGDECGCYVLFYVNLFLENAPETFSSSDGYPYFMKEDWFTIESLDNFRHRLGSVPAEVSD